MRGQVRLTIAEGSQIGSSRRVAQRMAEHVGLSETDSARVAIIATELCTNIVRHAGRGDLFVQQIDDEAPTIEMLAIDAGVGMASPLDCLRDGFSTIGTSGTGLGAIKRQSDEFDLFTQEKKGTIVLSRVRAAATKRTASWRWGAVSAAAPGETVCGDAWKLRRLGEQLLLLIADGLGHGPLAADAADCAVAAFDLHDGGELTAFMERAHRMMRSTRGGALGAVRLEPSAGSIQYCGIGNISGMLLDSTGGRRTFMNHNGTVGAEVRTMREVSYPWNPNDRLIMFSDGLHSRWSLDGYEGLNMRHPAILSGILFRDFARGRDDATVVVVERVA